MKSRIEILSTAFLETQLCKKAANKDIQIDVISFIEVNKIEDNFDRVKAMLAEKCTVIFTSVNSVKALSGLFSSPPRWSAYCLENATLNEVQRLFKDSPILGTAANAKELAEKIISDRNNKKIFFFCGKSRRDELPQMVYDAGIEMEEIVVYETVLTPKNISKHYDGILFFSPSAVESFYSCNSTGSESTLFAIGGTTAQTIRKYSSAKINVAKSAGREQMIDDLIDYFNSKENNGTTV